MGLFNGIKSNYKKSEAAVVVQNLLQHYELFDLDPASMANKLVAAIWKEKPDVFSGKFGQRPHKLTVAAAALANGIYLFAKSDLNRNVLALSFGAILSDVEKNGRLYPLNSLDHQLLKAVASIFAETASEDPDVETRTSVDQVLFVGQVLRLRQAASLPEQSLPMENLVGFYAVNLADLVFRIAKNSDESEHVSTPTEKAATAVICTQVVHMGWRMAGLKEDKELKSTLMQNALTRTLHADLNNPSPQSMAEMALAVTTYNMLATEYLPVLEKIDMLARSYLADQRRTDLVELHSVWLQIVSLLQGKKV
jgi:hypothetical protein